MDPTALPASALPLPGPGKEAPAAASPAEPTKAKTPDLANKFSNPKILDVLKKREAAKAAAAPSIAASDSPAPAAVVKPDAAQATPPPEAKPGDDGKQTPKADAPEVIDFTQLGTAKPEGDDTPPSELTGADALDLEKVKAKLSEAHKDSAAQRKLKREAAEKATKLEGELKATQAELEALKQAPKPAAQTGRYLDRFTKVEEVTLAHQDALETIKQLTEDPERESVTLSGNRVWKLVDGEGKSMAAQAADTALEILESYDTRVKQLTARGDAEKLVTEKLPLLTKAIPDFEKRYKTVLDSDWSAQGPSISLNAAVGELVTSGAYVLTKAGQPAAKPAAQPPAAEKAADLPSTTPPVRPVETGKPDTTDLRARALKGDKKALREWIAIGGKSKA